MTSAFRRVRQALVFPVREACLDDDVGALDITELAQSLHEHLVAAGIQRRLARAVVQKTDARSFRGRLGKRAWRRRKHTGP
jgi:hypothetical protein